MRTIRSFMDRCRSHQRSCFHVQVPPLRIGEKTLGNLRASSTRAKSQSTSMLRSPTMKDAQELLKLMDGRDGSVLTKQDDIERYNQDWTVSAANICSNYTPYEYLKYAHTNTSPFYGLEINLFKKQYIGKSFIVVKPKNTQEVSALMKYCNDESIGVVPQAGNTGLVGGSVPICDEIILSVENLNQIESFDEVNGILSCGSGCILQTLQEKVSSDWDHLVPIDLGAKGSCMIGGNISTNAGGQYYYRFGSIHANLIGLECVLPDGSVLDMMSSNRKDNTGYHMKHLFVGAEGTLGIVTKIALSTPRLPKARNALWLGCDTFQSVQKVLSFAKGELGEILAAFEFMDKGVIDLVEGVKPMPFTNQANEFSLLVETQGSNHDHDQEKIQSFLEKCLDHGDVVDGVIAQDLKQLHQMWEIRESCNPVVKACGYNYKYDVSLPIPDYYVFVEEMRARLSSRPDAQNVNWGHVIDGNLHFNVFTPNKFESDEEIKDLLEPYIFEAVMKRKGSISAEHGLGLCKNKYLGNVKSQTLLSMMHTLKKTVDPKGILNPGKYLPPSNY